MLGSRCFCCFENLRVLGKGSGVPESLAGSLGSPWGPWGVSQEFRVVLKRLGRSLEEGRPEATWDPWGCLGRSTGNPWRSSGTSHGVPRVFLGDLRAKKLIYPMEIEHFHVPKISFQESSLTSDGRFCLYIEKIEAVH